MRTWAPIALIVSAVAACDAPVAPTTLVGRRTVMPVPASPPWLATGVVRPATPTVFDGRLELLGAQLDDADGATLRGTLWWLVVGDLAGRLKPELVVTVGPERLTQPLTAALHALEWRRGDVVEVAFSVRPTAGGQVGVGVMDAGRAWPGSDGDVFVIGSRAGRGGGDEAPIARRRLGPVTVDGVLDEPDWLAAPAFTLRPWQTGATVTMATTVRFLWDDATLFVGFDVDDDDPWSPYTKRDEPLYESEALEVFIDADADRDVYVELQASPTGVQFDAAFAGGARRGMDVAWDAPFVTTTATRPGGYTQEWAIPVAALRGIPAGEPRVGARWSVNVFRLERRRAGGRVVATEASALSPPERGDFHALDRFVGLVFSD